MRQTNFKQQFIGLFLLTAILFGNFSTFAQTKRGAATVAASGSKPPAESCKTDYTGTINYTSTLTDGWTGKYGSFYTRKRVFKVTIPIRDDGGQTGSATSYGGRLSGNFNFKARATATLSDTEQKVENTENEQICKASIKGVVSQKIKCSAQTDRQGQATGEGDVTVFVGLNGDKIQLSSDVPRIVGQSNENYKSECPYECKSRPAITNSRMLEINDKKQGFYTDPDAVTFNPASFNRLNGSFTRTDGKEVETVTWNLSRCAPPLRIEQISFDEHHVPDAAAWHGVDSRSGTIDGNLVKVKATIFNGGGDTAYPSVKFSETTAGVPLPNATVSAAIKAGETRDVEYEWDTNGYAWDDNQKAKMEREIKAEIDGDSKTERIKIKPKPVVLVHGLWSNSDAWANYPIYLRNAHSYDWEAFPVGSDPENGKMNTGDHAGNWSPTNTIFQNSQELAKQIKHARTSRNAWHIDIVAHSMGGLISRHYIHNFMLPVFDNKPEVAHLVMLGTPNQGSPCANMVDGLFHMFGNNEMLAIKELRPYTVGKFNAVNTNRKGVKFSILAGYTVPTTCQSWGISDGVVPLASALYNITDRDYSTRIHTELTKKADFEKFALPRLAVGPNKARADIASAKLETDEKNFPAQLNAKDSAATDRYGFGSYFQKAAFKSANNEDDDESEEEMEGVTTRQKIELQPKETKEIEIPVRDGNHAGVLIVASYSVVATLLDESGTVVGKNIFDRADAPMDLFRTINADRAIKNGVWKLRLENFDTNPMTAFVAGWTNNGAPSGFTLEAGKSVNGTVHLQAKWIENNQPVVNAKITGKIVGQSSEIEFFDDGKHADGAANDGIYGAATEKLGKGEYFVEANATANNSTKMAVAQINVGGAAIPAKAVSPKAAVKRKT